MADARTIDSELDEIVKVATKIVASHDSTNKASPSSAHGATAPTSEDENMDFDSDDDDDSKSNHSNSNQRDKKRKPKGEQKRSHHNVLERKRRDLIKDSFSKLRDCVPSLKDERVSRAEILRRAADFIQLTVTKNADIQADIDKLVEKNNQLERVKGKLEDMDTTGDKNDNNIKIKQEEGLIADEEEQEVVHDETSGQFN